MAAAPPPWLMVVCGLTGDGSGHPLTVAQYADEAGYYVGQRAPSGS